MNSINLNWMRISKQFRDKILNSVWCSTCKEGVTIVDYFIDEDERSLTIQGRCKNCGNAVVRIVEKE